MTARHRRPRRSGAALLAALALAALVLAAPGRAGEVVVGLGADDVAGSAAPAVGVEYRPAPRWSVGPAAIGLGIAAEADGDGGLWGGAGLVLTAPLGATWRLEASVMPGAHSAGSGRDLGRSAPIFRSQIGVSAAVAGGWRAGVALNHKSNANTASENPGAETLLLTLGRAF